MATENTTPAFQAKENYYARKALTPLPEPHITGMKLLGDVSLGSLTLNTRDTNGTLWVCTEIDNWWTLPEPDYPSVEKAFGDGSYDVNGRYQQKEISLEGSILVPSPDLAPAARETLIEALNLVYTGAWLKTVEDQGSIAALSSGVLTDNVATITTASIHSFNVGDVVVVAGSGTNASQLVFYGTHTITAKTSNTFSFAKTNANVSVTALPGTGTVGAITKASWVRLGGSPKITSVTPRGRLDFSVDLIAPDPIKYYWSSASDGFESATINPKNTSTSVTGIYTINNRGNSAVGVQLTVAGPVVGPLTIKNTTTKQTLKINSSITGATSLTVAKKAYFDGLATLTTEGPHGLYIGKQVVISGVDSDFNGTYLVEEIPADNKFSYSIDYGDTSSFDAFAVGKSLSVSSRSVTDNVATITTASAHGFTSGMEVKIYGFTSGAEPLNGIWQIKSVPTPTTFTFDITTANLSAVTPSNTFVIGNIATLYSSSVLPYDVGDLITVENMNAAINTSNAEILSVAADEKSLTYYSNRTRAVKNLSYENTPDETATDQITLTTWERHGVRVGDLISVQGCGRPVNLGSATSIVEGVATEVTVDTITFPVPTFTRKISEISIAKASGGNYRVTVKTVDDILFQTGDLVFLRALLPTGATQPPGINGAYTIQRVGPKTFHYDVRPKSSTKSGLIDFFGADSGKVPLATNRNNYATLENIQKQPINTENTNNVGGRVTSFVVIPQTERFGRGTSDLVEEQKSSGTVTVSGDSLVLDTKDRSAYLNDDPSFARGKLAAVTDWIKLAPGNNSIEVIDAGDDTPSATVTMKYRSGWLS